MLLLNWILFIIFQVIEIGSNDGSDDKMFRCYKCFGWLNGKSDCGRTCNASAGGACYVHIRNDGVFQGCYSPYLVLEENIEECQWRNRGLLGLSKLTPSTKSLCYICYEDMCNEFAKIPRDNLSVYNKLLPDLSNAHPACYECDSRNLKDCDRNIKYCKETVTCYSLYQDGIYKQGCRNKDFLDDFECEKIQNSTNTTKEFCLTCSANFQYNSCNQIKLEEVETTTKKHDRQKSTPEFQVIEMLRCYECGGFQNVTLDCEKTCNASAGGACYVYIRNDRVFQGCYSSLEKNNRVCQWRNRGLLGLSILTPSTKSLCYICYEDMCNEFATMPRDDLYPYKNNLLPHISAADWPECYQCHSTNLKDCNRNTNYCKESLTCYSLYLHGIYKQGCRDERFLDDFKCEKIQNSTNTTKEFCLTCINGLGENCCNEIKPRIKLEELETTTKKRVRQKSTPKKDVPKKDVPKKDVPKKSVPEENEMGRKVTQDQSTKSSASKSAVPTFFFYLIWSSSTYLLLILIW